ncbi:MAG: 6-carboxytetrahydropterin synthase [Deltaproteobacteria bacterium]|nr:6-carboxytetrahydropterin synthase [Deltaproteobacteria bacterium]
MVYRIHRSIDISFAHHVRGHRGACVNIHGHTWKFEVGLEADTLDAEGFVVDFAVLKQRVLEPCHRLLDHSLAVGADTFRDIAEPLAPVGERLIASRLAVHDEPIPHETPAIRVGAAEVHYPGGMKVAVFPFSPTSERLAEWLFHFAERELADDRVRVAFARVYETLHPVESVAEFTRT